MNGDHAHRVVMGFLLPIILGALVAEWLLR